MLILLIVVFSFPVCYGESRATLTLVSQKQTIKKGEDIEIVINIKNEKTAAFTCYLYFDKDKLDYILGPENTNVIGNQIIHVWYDQLGGIGAKEGELAKFIFKAKEEGTANFNLQGEFYNEVAQLIPITFEEKQIQIEKEQESIIQEQPTIQKETTNTNLETLALENILLNPPFETNQTNYQAEISNELESIHLLAIPENEQATVQISGNENLIEGNNQITIEVTAPNGITKRKYLVEVYKRNIEEEKNYQEERKLQKQKLEQAYEISQVSTKTKQESQKKNYFPILLIIGIIFLLGIFFYKKLHISQKQ